ncbi:MAG: B12-binding domain-containing radical SAM protein [Thermoprotei archaeon]|nr:MAG: B12-binding domain-containing radical SAM protein [Thermoprotei archaeon]
MRVMLVQPNSASAVKSVLGATGVPLGLAYLAATLRDEHDVRVVDALTLDYTLDDLRREFRKYEPDVVGVTATTPAIYDAYAVARLAKKLNPEVKTVVGGPHVTFTAEETLAECEAIDVVVRGEGELTLKELLSAWERGLPLKGVGGITFRHKSKIRSNEPRPFMKNLDELPFPAYDLLPMKKYEISGHRFGNVMTSRGCPFKCIFCASSTLFGKKWRARSPENVIDELRLLRDEYGIREIEFLDDTFTLSKKRAERICDLMIRERLEISWSCSSHVNTVSKKLAEKLKKAGCHSVYVGVESGSQRILDIIGKNTTLEKAERAVKTLKEAGLNVLASFIIGVPGETVSTIKSTIRLAKKLKPTYAQFTLCTPFPGTKLFELALKRGLLLTRNWARYTTLEPVMSIPGMTAEQLKKWLRKAYLSFYLRPRFLLEQILCRRFFVLKKALLGTLASLMTEARGEKHGRNSIDS